MSTITKVEVVPVVPVEIRHHQELPEGSYHVILTGFRQNLYLVKRFPQSTFHLVNWMGKGGMLRQFDIKADGSIEYDDPNDRPFI